MPLEIPEMTPSGEILDNDKALDNFRINIQSYSANTGFREGYEQAEKDYAKLKELADNMYSAAQYLTTDASRLHKAMEEYHKFVCYELNKK